MGDAKTARRLVSAVGVMSTAFGLFDFVMADRLAGKVGMKNGRTFRAAGLREIATGLAAIGFPASPLPIAARLAGDATDTVILGRLGAKKNNARAFAAWIGVGIVAAVTVVDVVALRAQRRSMG